LRLSNYNIAKTLFKYIWFVRRKKWFLRFPFLPIPPIRWILWRMETAWGIQADDFKWGDLPKLKVMCRDAWSFGRFLTMFTNNEKPLF